MHTATRWRIIPGIQSPALNCRKLPTRSSSAAGSPVNLVGSNERRLNETADAFKSEGLSAFPFRCDLAEPQQIDRLVEYVSEQHQRVDILVNNAGVTFSHNVFDWLDDSWRKTFQINLDAPFQLSKRFGAMMKDQESGSIINITSIGAERGFPNNPAYVAAKGALKQLTKSRAVDLGQFGIRVNNIGPGYFKTELRLLEIDCGRTIDEMERKTLETLERNRPTEPDGMDWWICCWSSGASRRMAGEFVT